MGKDKIELKVFTNSYVEELLREIKITSNIDNYYNVNFPFKERFPKGNTNIFIDNGLSLNPGITGKLADADLESCIILYENLKLNEIQASDPRLWTYLTHVTFWPYMRERWGLENVRKTDSPIGRVYDRYFLIKPNLELLSRNGISRLWWYAHLTVDEKRKDKYELTRILLRREEVPVGILERVVGTNYNTRTGLLEFLQEHDEILSNENLTRQLLKAFNLFGGTKILPLLSKNKIKQILERIKPAA
ncbi:MAG TPA: DUF6339 family protein [Mucilaginibacter sp.]|jgi:hypothetical protein|nr:DUF6339 family protein [Mucilaginibacter sp.]